MDFEFIYTESEKSVKSELLRNVDAHPFIPSDTHLLEKCCDDILNIQALGLMRRLEITNCKNLVVGISGGLDSTLALLAAVRAFDKLNLDRKGIWGITLPCFGTTDRTHNNAMALCQLLNISFKEISIKDSVIQHLKDLDHPIDQYDTTYENAQARERTQVLMDYANKVNGMVLGTGDLSELALGWCTYNGDQMSMYAVNTGVPKTLVKEIVKYYAEETDNSDLSKILLDIVDTPISPELIPSNESNKISQVTEDIVGPYELHDFFLFNMLKYSFNPRKIYLLANIAFNNKYDGDTIKHWLKVFYRRFFTQQFKRSSMPDGPKVIELSLSPRSDAKLWLDECETL